ncbi:transcriptional regulator, AraC family [Cnuella takakiae]|uniref:Transcriptional regulator, AraC family n=1 Tax=Cnuella takakiae TaxID=1302690 RepID=A0A1M4VCG6_9BACT|nr:AraC family transcriptional regulator [Cnuella takakiae]OLY92639.1 AraC family transcriptional regulator [Cnuella takakiae]SHE66625.1 transcriptional regulator, AraC family [Cnuella takakiae]
MKAALHKSAIPETQIFQVRHLRDPHFDPVWHAHSEYQLFLVLQGSGTRFIGDSITHFGPGELVFTGPHLPHLWRSDEAYFRPGSNLEVEGIVVYLNEHFLGNDILKKTEMVGLQKFFERSLRGLQFQGTVRSKVARMLQNLCTLHGLPSVILLLQMLDLLASTHEFDYVSSRTYEGHETEQEKDRVNLVYAYLLRNFKNKISLEEIAALLHMTPTSFSRYFTSKTGRPFSRFLAEIRISHACKLLTNTEATVAQVCYECGYSTLSNFNKHFREIMHQNPVQYKREFLSI